MHNLKSSIVPLLTFVRTCWKVQIYYTNRVLMILKRTLLYLKISDLGKFWSWNYFKIKRILLSIGSNEFLTWGVDYCRVKIHHQLIHFHSKNHWLMSYKIFLMASQQTSWIWKKFCCFLWTFWYLLSFFPSKWLKVSDSMLKELLHRIKKINWK